EAQTALAIGDAEQSVLAPAVRAAAGVIVREVIPAIAVGGVVLADRSPLALGEVRTPALPVARAARVFLESGGFGSRVGHRAQGRIADLVLEFGVGAAHFSTLARPPPDGGGSAGMRPSSMLGETREETMKSRG